MEIHVSKWAVKTDNRNRLRRIEGDSRQVLSMDNLADTVLLSRITFGIKFILNQTFPSSTINFEKFM